MDYRWSGPNEGYKKMFPNALPGLNGYTADVIDTALGIQTPHQRAVKAHTDVVKEWREICWELREQDRKNWEEMTSRIAMMPLA